MVHLTYILLKLSKYYLLRTKIKTKLFWNRMRIHRDGEFRINNWMVSQILKKSWKYLSKKNICVNFTWSLKKNTCSFFCRRHFTCFYLVMSNIFLKGQSILQYWKMFFLYYQKLTMNWITRGKLTNEKIYAIQKWVAKIWWN